MPDFPNFHCELYFYDGILHVVISRRYFYTEKYNRLKRLYAAVQKRSLKTRKKGNHEPSSK